MTEQEKQLLLEYIDHFECTQLSNKIRYVFKDKNTYLDVEYKINVNGTNVHLDISSSFTYEKNRDEYQQVIDILIKEYEAQIQHTIKQAIERGFPK